MTDEAFAIDNNLNNSQIVNMQLAHHSKFSLLLSFIFLSLSTAMFSTIYLNVAYPPIIVPCIVANLIFLYAFCASCFNNIKARQLINSEQATVICLGYKKCPRKNCLYLDLLSNPDEVILNDDPVIYRVIVSVSSAFSSFNVGEELSIRTDGEFLSISLDQ